MNVLDKPYHELLLLGNINEEYDITMGIEVTNYPDNVKVTLENYVQDSDDLSLVVSESMSIHLNKEKVVTLRDHLNLFIERKM